MNKVVKSSCVVLAILVSCIAYAQDKKKLLSDFTSTDWKVVKEAKFGLENIDGIAIPDLINLCEQGGKKKLTNTGSLIYPGAEKFFGYGQMIDYDIDYIAVRCGWLIEEISFNNFGFSGLHLPKDDLTKFIKITFPEYYNNSGNRKKIESLSGEELRALVLELAISNLKEWWKSEGDNFKRIDALVSALKSFDEKRQVKALFYLRNGTTKCEGLTKEFYYEEIAKEIVRLSGSDVQRISEHAKLILLDSKLDWMVIKTN